MTGLVVDSGGFEMLVGDDRVGTRRLLLADDVAVLEALSARYVRAVQARSDHGVFVDLGRELFAWLDGDQGALHTLLERAAAPLVFEVAGPRSPSDAGWALLRAPFELLARPEGGGFLAADGLLRFAVVRRLGPAGRRPELGELRLGVAFMASAPRGQRELDFEAEEAAILAAVGDARIDLLVEDTGDPEQLGQRLADSGGMPVVHVSCHGDNRCVVRAGAPPQPVLRMENDTGGDRPTTATDLVPLLGDGTRLVFVSACLTATSADTGDHLPPGAVHKGDGTTPGSGGALVAHSLATALVAAGVPAVLGWDGSVHDRAATVFAQELYHGIAGRVDVAVAVGDARRALLDSDDPVLRADWHLARLWWGPAGGGPLVAGTRKRSLVSATHGTTMFLDRKGQVPVAAAAMFVGRRPEMQQALRVLRSTERAGVLLHGQGRLGKSSLAARLADRFPDRAVAVVFGDYSAMSILDAVAEAVRTDPAARDLITRRLPDVRHRPETIEQVLIDLVSGPLAQAGQRHRPLLLVIDDLEQILVADPAGAHRVAAEQAGVIAAVLRAFHPGETDSRLLVTSRFLFQLDGLEDRLEPVQLRPLSSVAQRKLQRRQQALTPTARLDERAGLAARVLEVSRGNPGLQDLIGLRLVYGEQVPLARAEAAVAGMESYLHRGDLPSEVEVRAILENLALDELLDEAGPAHHALLRAITLFDEPVPEAIIAVLAEQVGGSPTRLRGLGLLDPYPDPYAAGRRAVAANPLAAGRLEPLTPTERTALATVTAPPLLAVWGGTAPQPGRASQLDLQLSRLGLLAADPTVVATCARGAVAHLRDGPAKDAAQFGRDAIELLDRCQHAVPLGLLRAVADAALTSGDGTHGEELLDRAMREVRTSDTVEPLDQARVMTERAVRLITRGEPVQAEQLFEEAHRLFTAAGSETEVAAVTGYLADIIGQRGDLDEALRIRQDVELPTYERLGDPRSIAITWGKIAHIAAGREDYETAARMQRERLEVNKKLGDLDGIAAANWDLAQIDLTQQNYESAFPKLVDSFNIFRQLQRVDGIAIIGWTLGQLLVAASQAQGARQVLLESVEAAATIGRTDLVASINEVLANLPEGDDEE